jgi:hypothetical protein
VSIFIFDKDVTFEHLPIVVLMSSEFLDKVPGTGFQGMVVRVAFVVAERAIIMENNKALP